MVRLLLLQGHPFKHQYSIPPNCSDQPLTPIPLASSQHPQQLLYVVCTFRLHIYFIIHLIILPDVSVQI